MRTVGQRVRVFALSSCVGQVVTDVLLRFRSEVGFLVTGHHPLHPLFGVPSVTRHSLQQSQELGP